MRLPLLLAVLTQGAAMPVLAQQLPNQSRDPVGEAIRAALIDTPALLTALRGPASRPDPDLYSEKAARDRDLLEETATRLFSPDLSGFGPRGQRAGIALFTRENCPDCDAAEADLRRLAERLQLRVTLLDIDAQADLAQALGLDMAPSYVLPDMLLRGPMPDLVLERYLTR